MESLIKWFFLKSVPGVGNYLFKRLIDQFQSPERVLKATVKELSLVEGVGGHLAHKIKSHRPQIPFHKEIDLAQQKGYQIITLNDAAYPLRLKEIPDPPPFLFVHGDMQDTTTCIAVVGSRHATEYGIQTTMQLCRDIAGIGITIVSGMARGIDTAAHKGALMGGGRTIAVLGSGLERIYPKENRQLFHSIAQNGAVLSEVPLRAEPEAHHFPARNRIISGICLGTVVVEATKRSGSLITAKLAAEQNREVFAVPGSIRSFKSSGTHALIKEGAKLVEHPQDIIDELGPLLGSLVHPNLEKPSSKKSIQLSGEESQTIELMGPYPIHIDDLVRKAALPTSLVSSILLTLELRGLVHQLPGKLFALNQNRVPYSTNQ
jgi:DNA processing protein